MDIRPQDLVVGGEWSPTPEADVVARLQPPGTIIAQATDPDGITVRVVRGGDNCGDRLELHEWTDDRWVVSEDDTGHEDLYDDMDWFAPAEPEASTDDRDAHTEHCCVKHGCKYGRQGGCSVVDDGKPQSYPCWVCSDWLDENWDLVLLLNEMWDRGFDRGYGAGLSVITVK